ncbi:JAB domain-containing protein [Peptostreptococcus stomatis]|mgnify:FL=1|uniref:JAB domain-containing protein n=1 Tax=Peptostreptococcus stomatis TaxID=341694 RepID=UPI0024A8C465|nr:JAB domain-containing protein [Peptostreptococcus stomatis]
MYYYSTKQVRTNKGTFLELVKEQAIEYENTSITSSDDIYKIMESLKVIDRDVEQFWSICLDGKNKVCGIFLISQGCTNSAIVLPKEIYKRALMVNTTNIIFSHNHPSGVLTPSGEDIMLTKRLESAGELLGIKVLDHVIVSDTGFYSLKSSGDF